MIEILLKVIFYGITAAIGWEIGLKTSYFIVYLYRKYG